MSPNIFTILTLIILLVGPIVLQIFLSKQENKWLGLILPLINIILSVMVVIGKTFFANTSIARIIIPAIVSFLVYNIPTAILIAIYYSYRAKLKKIKEIDKMNIQDLH